jgi:DnaJ homolog subfamily C member 28
MVDKIDEQIRRAMEDGEFENFPGKGKPLSWDENPFEDPEWRMANHILREGGFSLPWIEARQEIESELEVVRRELDRAWMKRQASVAQDADTFRVETEWKTAQNTFRQKIAHINMLIRDYNLQAPVLQVQMLMLQPDREIEKTIGPKCPSGTI